MGTAKRSIHRLLSALPTSVRLNALKQTEICRTQSVDLYGETQTMRSAFTRKLVTVATAMFFGAAAVTASAQTARIPRLPDGKPNLNGIWQAMNSANYDLGPHAARAAMAMVPGQFVPVPCGASGSALLHWRGVDTADRNAHPPGRTEVPPHHTHACTLRQAGLAGIAPAPP